VRERVVIAVVGLDCLHISSGSGELDGIADPPRESHSFAFSARRPASNGSGNKNLLPAFNFANRLIILSNYFSSKKCQISGRLLLIKHTREINKLRLCKRFARLRSHPITRELAEARKELQNTEQGLCRGRLLWWLPVIRPGKK
jgi:hypothetical protein